MNKKLPLILLACGVIVAIVAILIALSRSKTSPFQEPQEEETVAEIPFEKRPFVSLTPTSDGHYLNLVVEQINVDAVTMDYELGYKVKDGRTQGASGNKIKIAGQDSIKRSILLGSESSGKFRYDEGVEEGQLTVSFRNDKGKLVGRVTTLFHLQNAPAVATSMEGNIKYTFAKTPKKIWTVTMNTFGLPISLDYSDIKGTDLTTIKGPVGVFASDTTLDYPGVMAIEGSSKIYYWNVSDWKELPGGSSKRPGVFIGL